MSASDKPDNELADQDIAALFDAQTTAVPELLRDRLFTEADKQAQHMKTSSNEKGVDHAHSVARYRWFGVAATALLALIVSPLLLKSPESALDEQGGAEMNQESSSATLDVQLSNSETDQISADDATAVMPDTTQSRQSSMPKIVISPSTTAASKIQNSILRHEASAPTDTLRDTAPLIKPSEAVVTQAASRIKTESTSQSLNSVTTSRAPVYRENVTTWKKEILILIADGHAESAHEEYSLFTQAHPEDAADFKHEYDRLMLESTNQSDAND